MPLSKRLLIHGGDLANAEQLVDGETGVVDLPTANFSHMLGAMRQLTMLSSFALETFQNLSVLIEDISERSAILSNRTESAMKKLVDVEKALHVVELQPENPPVSYTQKYFKKRQIVIPPLFIKASNYPSIVTQYKLCSAPPQLWRLENVVGDDLFQFFSFPGYFFQEWLRAELFKQEREKALRKANRALKKQQKREKKRKKKELQRNRKKSLIVRPTSISSDQRRETQSQASNDLENAMTRPTLVSAPSAQKHDSAAVALFKDANNSASPTQQLLSGQMSPPSEAEDAAALEPSSSQVRNLLVFTYLAP